MSKNNRHPAGTTIATEPWATRWYAPLVAIALGLLALMVVALAVVEMLVANAPAATPSSWSTPPPVAREAHRGVVARPIRTEAGHPQRIPGGLQ